MFDPKIAIRKDLYEKLKARAEKEGYASVDEFVIHVLEQIAEPPADGTTDDSVITKQLQGLGYID